LTDLYFINQKIISSRDAKIEKSEDKIERLQKELNKYYSVSFDKLTAEARTNCNGLKTLSYGTILRSNFKTTDTISVFGVVAANLFSIQNSKKKNYVFG
jgi:hypothetical protein